MHSALQRAVLTVLCVVAAPLADSRADLKSEVAACFDVSVELRAEIELLRQEMGRPADSQPEIAVKNTAPREVYFQARTLVAKLGRLSFELTRLRPAVIAPQDGAKITVADVKKLLSSALGHVRIIKTRLGITGARPSVAPAKPGSVGADQVFRSIVAANRQINLLLERRFSPSDVFQQVTVGVGYAAELLLVRGGADPIPKAAALVRRKHPADVYRRLVSCLNMIKQLVERRGQTMLELTVKDGSLKGVSPSDVYDIASVVVSELAFLHAQEPKARKPYVSHPPGRKFPSHVFQRAGILEAQLRGLAQSQQASKP